MHIKVLDCEDLFAQLAGHKIWIENPTWEQIEEAIDDLDGNGHSIIVLQKEINFLDDEYMVIGGGGSDHRYVCFIRTPEPNQLDWQLINPSGSTSLTAKILVSEMVELSLRDCVTYTDVLQAAETYALSGTKDKSLHWEQLELKTKFTWLEEKTSFQNQQSSKTIEPDRPEITQSQQLQQQLAQDKLQLKQLRSQLTKTEERISEARRTNIFGRPESGANEREKDRLVREIEKVESRITQNESLLKSLPK